MHDAWWYCMAWHYFTSGVFFTSGALKEQDFASGKNSKIATRHIKNLKNWRQETNGLMMEGTGFLFRIEDIHIHPTIHNIMMLCWCMYILHWWWFFGFVACTLACLLSKNSYIFTGGQHTIICNNGCCNNITCMFYLLTITICDISTA